MSERGQNIRGIHHEYPESQEEVDNMASRLHLHIGVIHDP